MRIANYIGLNKAYETFKRNKRLYFVCRNAYFRNTSEFPQFQIQINHSIAGAKKARRDNLRPISPVSIQTQVNNTLLNFIFILNFTELRCPSLHLTTKITHILLESVLTYEGIVI